MLCFIRPPRWIEFRLGAGCAILGACGIDLYQSCSGFPRVGSRHSHAATSRQQAPGIQPTRGGSQNAEQLAAQVTQRDAKDSTVVNFTRALASEWGKHRINVNALCPGFFPSKLSAGAFKVFGEDALEFRISNSGAKAIVITIDQRRKIDVELEVESLTPIRPVSERLAAWKAVSGHTIAFENLIPTSPSSRRLVVSSCHAEGEP